MFIKYKIMKKLNAIKFPNTIELNELIKTVNSDNDKTLIAIDVLGSKGYISCDASNYPPDVDVSLNQISSYVRYIHDIKVGFINWFIKISSFVLLIATLLLTADTERLYTIWQWLSDILSL